jgi:hypothetical protein
LIANDSVVPFSEQLSIGLNIHSLAVYFPAKLAPERYQLRLPSSPARFGSTNSECEETPVKKTILLSLSLLLLLVLKPTLQVCAGRGLPVRISQGGEVDNEVVNVSRSTGDEVVWSSDGDEFSISFQTSPFATSTFHVPAGGSASSGPVRPAAALGRYQYYISDDSNGEGADPEVNIKK